MSLGGRFWLKAMMPSQLCDELGQCVPELGRLYCAVKTSVCNWSQGHTGDPNGSRGPIGLFRASCSWGLLRETLQSGSRRRFPQWRSKLAETIRRSYKL